MAHALYGYDGSCRNIHGHSYLLEVSISGIPLDDDKSPKNGMLMDFKDLKRIVSDNIVSVFDHALVLNGNSPHKEINGLHENFEKVVFTKYQPTCENLLLDFCDRLSGCFSGSIRLHSVKLHETLNSSAEWLNDSLK